MIGPDCDIKRRLAAALEELLNNNTIRKISVQMITDQCCLSKRTFYNHFTDVNDLIFYIYYMEHRQINATLAIDKDVEYALLALLKHLRQHKGFYFQAIQCTGQNALMETMYKCIVQNPSSPKLEQCPDAAFALQLYWIGCIGMIKQWIESGMEESESVMAARMYSCIPGCLKEFERA